MKRALTGLLILMICIVPFRVHAATKGEENALFSAKTYLSFTAFSYQGLIEQLAYEGYSESECKYAADHCGADWFEQAVQKAEQYLSFTSFSKAGLIEQLEYEGFTKAQAEYGAAAAYGETVDKPSSQETKEITSSNIPQEPIPEQSIEAQKIKLQPGFDLSELSFQELLDLQSSVNQALWASDEWNEVTVPVGIYRVGEDIPAGRWTIKRSGSNGSYFRVGRSFKNGQVGNYAFTSDLSTQINLILEENTYIEISNYPVIFTPYTHSFAFK